MHSTYSRIHIPVCTVSCLLAHAGPQDIKPKNVKCKWTDRCQASCICCTRWLFDYFAVDSKMNSEVVAAAFRSEHCASKQIHFQLHGHSRRESPCGLQCFHQPQGRCHQGKTGGVACSVLKSILVLLSYMQSIQPTINMAERLLTWMIVIITHLQFLVFMDACEAK